jgi:hypothetical protein
MNGEKATIAKLEQLVRDAEDKRVNAGFPEDANYYAGFRDGLKRAIAVVKGRG